MKELLELLELSELSELLELLELLDLLELSELLDLLDLLLDLLDLLDLLLDLLDLLDLLLEFIKLGLEGEEEKKGLKGPSFRMLCSAFSLVEVTSSSSLLFFKSGRMGEKDSREKWKESCDRCSLSSL